MNISCCVIKRNWISVLLRMSGTLICFEPLVNYIFYVKSKNHCITLPLSWVIWVMVYIHRKYINTIESLSFNQTINFLILL